MEVDEENYSVLIIQSNVVINGPLLSLPRAFLRTRSNLALHARPLPAAYSMRNIEKARSGLACEQTNDIKEQMKREWLSLGQPK